MTRITKGMIAAALGELENIQAMAAESHNGVTPCYQRHAETANRHIAVLVKAGQPLPGWIIKNWGHLNRVCGWRGD